MAASRAHNVSACLLSEEGAKRIQIVFEKEERDIYLKAREVLLIDLNPAHLTLVNPTRSGASPRLHQAAQQSGFVVQILQSSKLIPRLESPVS